MYLGQLKNLDDDDTRAIMRDNLARFLDLPGVESGAAWISTSPTDQELFRSTTRRFIETCARSRRSASWPTPAPAPATTT